MIWGQMTACFVLWIAYGLWLRGRVTRLAQYWQTMPATKRTMVAGLMLIGGLVLLFVGLTLVAALRQLTPNGLTPVGLVLVFASGLGFTDLQVRAAMGLAVATLSGNRETTPPPQPSKDGED
ncbi:MAG: hypothetical protein JNJ45_08795 [Chthonomonas sp.]|nr:hypothetical protein [Chthonomonas sp.]